MTGYAMLRIGGHDPLGPLLVTLMQQHDGMLDPTTSMPHLPVKNANLHRGWGDACHKAHNVQCVKSATGLRPLQS